MTVLMRVMQKSLYSQSNRNWLIDFYRIRFQPVSQKLVFFHIIMVVLVSLLSCSHRNYEELSRQELFGLSIGKMEDQIDLFQIDNAPLKQKTSIFMRDGMIYVANGASAKVMEFSSYGDLLSLYYNAEENPKPVMLQQGNGNETIANRRAYPYAFRQVGEIAVTGSKIIYIEDRLPDERGIYDEKLGITLNKIVLRFKDGEYRGYLGQEGVGGTPFPYIQGIKVTNRDEVVVLCRTTTSWIVYWYSAEGELVGTVHIPIDNLPLPEGGKYFPSLETILPDPDIRRLYLKLTYYQEGVDAETGIKFGIEDVVSRIYWLDLSSMRYEGFVEIPENVQSQKGGRFFETREVSYLFELAGVVSGGYFFLLSREENDTQQLLILQTNGKVLRRRSLRVEDSSLVYSAFHVSSGGILTALLATDSAVKVVWWRADELIGGQ